MEIRVWELEWDDANIAHCEEHDLTPEVADEVLWREPVFFENRPGMPGSHVMIGPDEAGKLWTIILVHVLGVRWRPITGYESEHGDIELYGSARGRQS